MVGMVFQNPDNQFVGSTVEDDVAFGLENQGIPRDEMVERVHDALERVRMLDFAKREPARLSGSKTTSSYRWCGCFATRYYYFRRSDKYVRSRRSCRSNCYHSKD